MSALPYDIGDVCGTYPDGQGGGDRTWFDGSMAAGILLMNSVLFVNQRKYVEIDGTIAGSTTVIFAICNDVFMWGCADAEAILNDELKPLFMMWHENNTWGPVRWICIKRNEKPQGPIVRDMKAAGVWDDVLEALPENYVDAAARAKAGK